MSKILSPHDNGLRWSARLRGSQEKEEMQKRKLHTTYSTAEATKVAFGMFSLFALTSIITMPKHWKNTNAEFTEKDIKQLHEVKELYDGTLNKIYHLFYSTDITTNEPFTFHEDMKQEDNNNNNLEN